MTAEQQKKISSIVSKFSNLQGKHIILKKDEILYRQNEPSDSFYYVLSGIIQLTRNDQQKQSVLTNIKNDELLGIEDILKNDPRSGTAVAFEDTDLIKIELIDSNKNQAEEIYRGLAKTKISNDIMLSISDSKSSKNLYSIHEVYSKKVISFYGRKGNLSNAVFFKNVLFSFIDEGNINLIVDLIACGSIDSTFLGTLIASLKKVTAKGGNLKLVCNENLCSWLFVMTKMDKVFEIYGSLEDAVAN